MIKKTSLQLLFHLLSWWIFTKGFPKQISGALMELEEQPMHVMAPAQQKGEQKSHTHTEETRHCPDCTSNKPPGGRCHIKK